MQQFDRKKIFDRSSVWICIGLVIFVAGCSPSSQRPSKTSTRSSNSGSTDRYDGNGNLMPREPIYDVQTPGEQLIAAAIKRAKAEHKHVLIEWGGNWCSWCIKLHDLFTTNDLVQPIVYEEFELVLVDNQNNHELMLTYGGQERQYSFPHLTVLDSDGHVIANQNTEPLELGKGHDPKRVVEFLHKWKPEKLDANLVVKSSLAQSSAEHKPVLLRVGNPYCGWCKILSRFFEQHQNLFDKAFINIKIDTLRMTHGQEVAERYQPAKSSGVPWMVILDASGNELTNSVGPMGNIGYPYQPQEIEHFLTMIKSTTTTLSDSELATIHSHLNEYRIEKESQQH